MRKFITSSMFVVGIVSLPVSMSLSQARPNPPSDYRHDPRLASLRTFFSKADCPAATYSEAFLEAADAYELDWRLLPSLSYVESTGGKSAHHNNLFGWDSGRAHFPNPIAAIHAVGYRLANSVLYKDKELDSLLATYNPNLEYVQKVKSVMRRISPSE
jgi:hypothetical protein